MLSKGLVPVKLVVAQLSYGVSRYRLASLIRMMVMRICTLQSRTEHSFVPINSVLATVHEAKRECEGC